MAVAQRIAITGASGLIGSALVGYLKSEGHTVQRLVRRATVAPDEIKWDPKTGYVDIDALRGVDAVIHLAGVGVGDLEGLRRRRGDPAAADVELLAFDHVVVLLSRRV